MADLIDRQAAIEALHMNLMYRMGTDSNKERLDEWINSLPSAQPERKMGRSVDEDAAIKIVAYECGEFAGLAKRIEKQIKTLPSAQPERKSGLWIWQRFNIECSECGAMPDFDSTEPLYKFCPYCGVVMRGEQDG